MERFLHLYDIDEKKRNDEEKVSAASTDKSPPFFFRGFRDFSRLAAMKLLKI
jgi:hypothetical protein